MFNVIRPPKDFEWKSVSKWLYDELTKISVNLAVDKGIRIYNVAPVKYFDGMMVMADGTNWDPGSGEGVYVYYNSAWNKL